MKRTVTLLALACLSIAAQVAHAAQPTPQSIERLLAVSKSDKMLEAMKPQMGAMMKAGIDQALAGRNPGAEEQKVIDKFVAKASAAMVEDLSMEKFRPMFLEIYGANFSQEEVDGMITFYESPVGQSMLSKMPAVMQSIMGGMPKRMAPLMEKIQQAGKEMAAELAALKKKQSGQ